MAYFSFPGKKHLKSENEVVVCMVIEVMIVY